MINNLYVLKCVDDNTMDGIPHVIVSQSSLFNDEQWICEFIIPRNINQDDHTQLCDFIISKLREDCDDTKFNFDNLEFFIYESSDYVKYKEGKIVDRNFTITPMYIDRCSIEGDFIYQEDDVRLIIQRPNSDYGILIEDQYPEDLEGMCDGLIQDGYLDNNCSATFFGYNKNDDTAECIISDGKLVIPATIIGQ